MTSRVKNHEDCRPGTRNRWKAIQQYLVGDSFLDIGCAHGDGCEFVPIESEYVGVDANIEGIPFQEEYWSPYRVEGDRIFFEEDLRLFLPRDDIRQWDTIVALEVLEHLEDGLLWAKKFKQYARRVIVSVPENRSGQGEINNGHVLMNLMPTDFPGYRKVGTVQHSMILLLS